MLVDADYLNKLNTILSSVYLACGERGVIAGGAIRDMLLEKEIADVDLFLTENVTEKSLKLWFDKVEPCENGMYEDNKFNVLFKCFISYIPVPIQIIQVKGPIAEHINDFPCSLSRVSYSTEQGLCGIGKEFLLEAQAKLLLFDRKVNSQYVEKMAKKFPEYTLQYAKPEYAPHYFSQTVNACLDF